MQGNRFGKLLSDLSKIVEKLAKAHEQEVEEAVLSKQVEVAVDVSNKAIWEQDANKFVPHERVALKNGLLSKERISALRLAGECDTLLGREREEKKLGQGEDEAMKEVCTEEDEEGEDREVEVVEEGEDEEGEGDEMNQRDTLYGNAMTEMKSLAQMHFFRPRKPWCDHREFDKVRVSHTLQSHLLRSRSCAQSRRRASIAQVRQSTIMPGKFKSNDICVTYFISHPESKGRGLWVLACMTCLLYDLIMVPVEVCFDLEKSGHARVIDIVQTLFWTVDIFYNFVTGVHTARGLEMRPCRIAIIYARSYFLVDLMLVFPDWMTLLDDNFHAGPVAILRVARWGRLVRLLRLARVLRVVRMKSIMRKLIVKFHLSTLYVQVTQGWLGLCLLYLLIMHLVACAWFAIGKAPDDGWFNANDLASASTIKVYTISLHWCISRLSGLSSNRLLGSATEIVIDAVLIYASLFLLSFCIGTVTTACLARANSSVANLWKFGITFVQRHRISTEVDLRLVKFLSALHCAGVGAIAAEEATLLQALPPSLQQDLLFEARADFLLKKPVFRDLALINEGVLLRISVDTMSPQISVEREVIFAHGDACTSVLFITSGTYWYAYAISPWEVLKEDDQPGSMMNRESQLSGAAFAALGIESHLSMLGESAILSEAILWTSWEHCGSLLAAEESTALRLDAVKFAEVIQPHRYPFMHSIRYAKLYVRHLNFVEGLNDLTEFPELTIENLDNFYEGTPEDHLIFISHYKVEAGTEATLIRDSLEPIIRNDMSADLLNAPVFVDSEDLIDLAQLKEHVVRSKAVVLLLTPSVLSRPWCLIELVTAIQTGVTVVPVEVQRPGSSYDYPDEDFYTMLVAGLVLGEDSVTLLEQEGIQLSDVEQAVRQVFRKISLPFSPHKKKSVREAELMDILERCDCIQDPAVVKRRSSNRWTSEVSVKSVRDASVNGRRSSNRFPTEAF